MSAIFNALPSGPTAITQSMPYPEPIETDRPCDAIHAQPAQFDVPSHSERTTGLLTTAVNPAIYSRLKPAPVIGVSEVLGVCVTLSFPHLHHRTTWDALGVQVVVDEPVVTVAVSTVDEVVTAILQLPDLASDDFTGEGTAGPGTTPFDTVTPA